MPPVQSGLLALGRHGAAYLRRCRRRHGDAFVLRLGTQRMLFVFAPATLQAYFTAPLLTFAPAVEQFTNRCFGLAPWAFAGKHTTMLQVSLAEALVACSPGAAFCSNA